MGSIQNIVKKTKYIVAPYIIMSLPMALTIALFSKTRYVDSLNFIQAIKNIAFGFLVGSTVPSYWYIPFVCLIFCCAPIFALTNKFPKLYLSIIPLLYLAAITGRPFPVTNPFHSFVYFLPVYLIGMVFAKYHHLIVKRNRKIVGFVSLSISIVLTLIQVSISHSYGTVFFLNNAQYHFAFDINLFQKVFLCFFLFNVFPTQSSLTNSWLTKLADASFAMFFIHDYLSFVLQYLSKKCWNFDLLSSPNIGILLIFFVCVFSFSYLIAIWMKQISGKYSRFIIGW